MKKRFLPFSLLLVIMIFGQSVMADQIGHYVPRSKETATADAYLRSMRVNQHTGLIDPALMIAASNQSSAAVTRNDKGNNDIYWVSMGPDNMGGKTTSIVYHKNPETQSYTVYIGSMGGGVYYTWNKGITWHQVGENLMVSCMTRADDGTIYVGTGDGNTSANFNGLSDLSYTDCFVGSGLYKIKNNVMTRIESTVPSVNDTVVEWSYINDVAVAGNTIIVAANDGLKYSTDEITWNYAKFEGEDRAMVDLTGNAACHITIASGGDLTLVGAAVKRHLIIVIFAAERLVGIFLNKRKAVLDVPFPIAVAVCPKVKIFPAF